MTPSTLYFKQEKALESFFLDPPLTKAISTSPNKRRAATHNMKPLSHPTLNTRVRTLRELVGFAFKWLGAEPTMELVLYPQVVAKYLGFHVAKGTMEGTLKRIATHLHQATTFVISNECPRMSSLPSYIPKVQEWYTNLNGKILSSITTTYKVKERGTTLWEVWEAITSKWEKLQAKLKVSGNGGRSFGGRPKAMAHTLLSPPITLLTHPPHPLPL